ncbi:hypothetical protein NYE46_06480 [Listeria sp. FSL L8-0308]
MLSGTREGDMLRLTVSDDGGDIGAERLNDIRKSLDAERGSAVGFGRAMCMNAIGIMVRNMDCP